MGSSNREGLPEAGDSGLAGVRVLVVEDTWFVAAALKDLLESFGIRVVGPAATTTDAERLVAAQRPELAVIDVNLKGETAHDLIDRLCDEGVGVVVVSGYAGLPRLTDKAAVILQKPIDAPDLIAGLRQAVSGVAARDPHRRQPRSATGLRQSRRD
jgi:DNA-binding NtrC family response regulator